MSERWEYKEIVRSPFCDSFGPYPMTTDEMNERGAEGWELVAIKDEMSKAAVSTWFGDRYFFKRRKDERA